MTALAGTITPDEGQDPPQGESGRPFWQHALGLLVLLAALVPLVGTDSAFVTDESFVVIQLDTIEDTGQWALPHPLPEVDPEGAAFPLHGAVRYESGYTLYGKHPALIYLYLPVHRAFGIVGLVALSVLGTWAAALVASRLAGRIRAGSGIVALWLVGAASPLFFDAYVIHAHTVAAALAGLSVLLVLRAMDEDRMWLGLGAVAAVFAVALLRSEGVLFAGALGGATALVGLLRRRLALTLLGAAAVGAGAAAQLLDRAWSAAVANGDYVEIDTFDRVGASFLDARVTSLSFTLLMPGYRGVTVPEVLTLLGAALLVVGAVVVRRRPGDKGAVVLPITGAALLAARSVLEWGPVPGLVVAFCVGTVGLVLLGGPIARSSPSRFLLLTSGVFAVAVALTQYAVGGHTEWGGRYFALAVPLLGAVSAASLDRALATWPRSTARAMRVSLVVATVAMGVLAVSTLRSAHDRNRARSDGVLAAAAELPVVAGQPPIVVTEDDQVPRLARGRYDEVRFLLVPPSEVDRYLGRLADEGVEQLLLVSVDPEESLDEIPTDYEQVGPIVRHPLQYDDGGGLIRLRLVEP